MKNRKINTDRQPLTPEEIAAQKDFDKVFAGYQKAAKPTFSIGRRLGIMAVAASIVGALIVVFVMYRGQETVAPFINPPIAGLEVPMSGYQVDAATGAQFIHPTGSRINIPANAFVDADGNVVTGTVDLSYREFHDPLDIIFSGIPMGYDSGGVGYHFESAGMLDMNATKAGKQLKVNPEKKIQVDMVAKVEETRDDAAGDFNMYILDTVQQRWVLLSTNSTTMAAAPPEDTAAPVAVTASKDGFVSQADVKYNDLLAQLGAVEAQFGNIKYPIKPKKASTEKQRFDIRFNRENFKEIVLMDGVFFEPAAGQDIDPKFYKIPWKGAILQRVDTARGLYSVTLSQDGVEHTYNVYPVYLGSNYTTAVKMYNKAIADNQLLADGLNAERKRLGDEIATSKKTLLADRAAEKKKWDEQKQKWATAEKNAVAVASTSDLIYRSFTVSQFGVMNCDRPVEEPSALLAVTFEDDKGKALDMSRVFLMETDRNLVYEYGGMTNMRYDTTAENLLLGITTDNKVVKFSPERFRDIPKDATAYVFRMEVVKDKMKAPGD